MSKIIGNTVGIPNPISDWNQTDPNKADYIKNKPNIKLSEKQLADINDIGNIRERVDELGTDVSTATNIAGNAYELATSVSVTASTAYNTAGSAYELAEGKQDKTTIIDDYPDSATGYVFNIADSHNKDIRLYGIPTVMVYFKDDEYPNDYISGLSFYSGETPTHIGYSISKIINWVGTDCSTDIYVDDGGVEKQVSIFQPSANTHYDIVFYFNGTQFIGLVNGFKSASRNVVSE